jgi:NitT/TauT family transport system substrate-binding protein
MTLLAIIGVGAPAFAAETVKIAGIGLTSDVAMYAAIEKGYFDEAGIRVDIDRFASGAKMIPALATGDVDVAGGAAAAGLYNAIASGMDFKIVADKGQSRPGQEYTVLIVRKDLIDSGAFKDLADLKGRKVAHLPGQGVVTQYVLGQILEHAKLPWNAVERVDIAAPEHVKLLANKQVDAAVTAEPYGAIAEAQGVGKRILVADRIKALERLQVATIMFSGKFIRERPQAARAFLAAYVKGARFYNQYGPKSDEVIGVLTKHVRVTPADIRASMPFYLSPDGRPNVESLAAQQEWYLKMGMVKQKVPMERAVDLSLLP